MPEDRHDCQEGRVVGMMLHMERKDVRESYECGRDSRRMADDM